MDIYSYIFIFISMCLFVRNKDVKILRVALESCFKTCFIYFKKALTWVLPPDIDIWAICLLKKKYYPRNSTLKYSNSTVNLWIFLQTIEQQKAQDVKDDHLWPSRTCYWYLWTVSKQLWVGCLSGWAVLFIQQASHRITDCIFEMTLIASF